MRAVVQRVQRACVEVDDIQIGQIKEGLLVYVGIEEADTDTDIQYMAKKIAKLRIFYDQDEKMNESVLDRGFSVLLISQFTLYGDARKGNRPSFIQAARPQQALEGYGRLQKAMQGLGIHVETGKFQADMMVSSVNDGPVTILLDSKKNF